jgi:hypothetical protein
LTLLRNLSVKSGERGARGGGSIAASSLDVREGDLIGKTGNSCPLRFRDGVLPRSSLAASSSLSSLWPISSHERSSVRLIRPPNPSRSWGLRYHWADMTDGASEPETDEPSSATGTFSFPSGRVIPVLDRLLLVRGVDGYGVLEKSGVPDRLGLGVFSGEKVRRAGKEGPSPGFAG